MPWGFIVSILEPIIMKFLDHALSKDKSTMGIEKATEHDENIECLKGMCEHIKKIKV